MPLETLDPADAITLPDWEIILAFSEGAIRQQPGSDEPVPGLAVAPPEVSDDGLTYTFQLDPEASFSDGLALTAPLYVESLQRVMTVGGRASDLVNNYVEAVEAPDEVTVELRLRRPVAFFPALLSSAPYVPVHPDSFPADQLAARPEPPIHGVGEWYVADLSEDQLVLEPNPEVDTDSTVERVTIHYLTSVEEMVEAMGSGDVDMLWRGVSPEAEETLAGMEGVTVERVPGGLLEFLTVNHALEPTDDPLVRQAMAMAVDRAAVAEELLGGALEPTFSPVPPGFLGSTEAFRDVYGEADTETAIQLLTEAGYSAATPAPLELAYPPERYGVHLSRAMEELERQFEATGLIDVTLTAQAWNTYVGEVVEGRYNAALLGWLYDFPDPHNYLAPLLLQGGLGGSGSGDPEAVEQMLALLDQASTEPDPERRATLYGELQEVYADQVVTLPLWMDPEVVAYRDHVSADPDGANPEALNIGPALRLDYSTLRLDR